MTRLDDWHPRYAYSWQGNGGSVDNDTSGVDVHSRSVALNRGGECNTVDYSGGNAHNGGSSCGWGSC